MKNFRRDGCDVALRAMIMAGGEGVRLRPLTAELPKPLVPLLGEPCMGYALKLLRRHGITEVGATLWYQPKRIRRALGRGEKWGVGLKYFEETTPLGTAGSVKMAMDQLRETFFVLSGDGLTDCDLTSALRFHREKGALATLVLRRVDIPLAYGVVMTDEKGKITRFIEKPGWNRVFSDLVNTGIYILEPEIFNYIPDRGMPDFGKDIFPALVERGLPVYGYEMDGYWCDIGDQQAYLTAQLDLLRGKVDLPHLSGIDPSAQVDPSAVVEGPCWIGPEAVIGPGARVIHAAVGRQARVGAGAQVDHSCLWDRAAALEKARVSGGVLCNGAVARNGAEISDGCALGTGAVAGAWAMLRPGVKVWPHLKVTPGAVAVRNVVTADLAAPQWSSRGAECDSAECACALCAAYLKVTGAKLVLTGGGDGALRSLSAGALAAGGARVLGCGEVTLPMLKTLVRSLRAEGGVYAGERALCFLDGVGSPLPIKKQKAISACVLRQEMAPAFENQGSVKRLTAAEEIYLSALLPPGDFRPLDRSLAVFCDDPALRRLAGEALTRMGVRRFRTGSAAEAEATGEELGFLLSADGESLAMFDRERVFAHEQTELLTLLLCFRRKGALHDLPGIPRAAESIAPLLPPDQSPLCLWQKSLRDDGLAALLLILEGIRERPLAQWLAELPETHLQTREIPVRMEDKGRVLRSLCQKTDAPHTLGEGVRFRHPQGYATVVPDAHRPAVRVTGEGVSAEIANELCDFYLDQIRTVTNGK